MNALRIVLFYLNIQHHLLKMSFSNFLLLKFMLQLETVWCFCNFPLTAGGANQWMK